MSKEISQVELRNIIANKTTLPPDIVNAFVDQFFEEIRKTIVEDSFLKLEGLGLFRIIKSGESQRILFLGSKQPVEESLNISDLKNKVDELLPENRLDDVESSECPFFEKIEHSLHFNTEEIVLDIVNEDSSVNPILEDQILYYPEKKQKSKLLKISAVVVIIVALVSLVAFIYSKNKKNDEGINYTINFVELENLDPSNFSYIIIPESDVSLEYISKTYYGCVEYWPYIYNANEDFVDNQLMIQAGSIVKIPKVMIDIIDYQNGNALINANKLGEQIKLEKNIN